MYNILIIYSSKKKQSGNRRNLKYIQVHNYATVTGVYKKTIVKIIWYFLKSNNIIISHKYNKMWQSAKTGKSELCDHASTVVMSSEIP